MIRFAALALPVLLAAGPVLAQEQENEGWGTGYHMGTAYAGLTNREGAHLGVYCSDLSQAGNSAIRTGPYVVLFSAPRKLTVPAPQVSVTFTIDGKPTPVPMTADVEEASTSFDWGPAKAFTTDQMKTLVEALRHGKTLSISLADPAMTEPFTLAGSGAALENILDCSKR